jgi:predicted nucleotidyltransferase
MIYEIKEVKEKIMDILEKYEVKRASLFGSIVRGEMSENSDIDLLIEFNGIKSLLDLSGLKIELQERLNCNVDVLTFDSIHNLLRERILEEQVVIL